LSGTKGCQPYPVTFKGATPNVHHLIWQFGDGTSDTTASPTHVYTQAGTYKVNVIATSSFGCTDTFKIDTIAVLRTPIAEFFSNAGSACLATPVSFTDSSLDVVKPKWFWSFGDSITSTVQNPTITFTKAGVKKICLTVTNSDGCSSKKEKSGSVQVFDLNPPSASPIMVASVASNSSVEVAWQPTATKNFSSYIVYRAEDNNNQFKPVATISNSATTFYTDTLLNTLHHVYCYKVQTISKCGKAISLDSLSEHCTINVTATVFTKNLTKVVWTPYIGCSISGYEVYRADKSGNPPVLVATVVPTTTAIIDTGIICPGYYSYRIKATEICGNLIKSCSDTSIAGPTENLFANQRIEVVRSSVVNNEQVYTEWKAPAIKPETVVQYKIYRSSDSVNYSMINTVDAVVHEYFDNDVEVNQKHYFYRIEAVNSCGATITSNNGTSILLNTILTDGNPELNWTPYSGWDTGVDHYTIEKLNSQGKWEIINTVDGKTLKYIDNK